jgi:hypothetical protein
MMCLFEWLYLFVCFNRIEEIIGAEVENGKMEEKNGGQTKIANTDDRWHNNTNLQEARTFILLSSSPPAYLYYSFFKKDSIGVLLLLSEA